MAINATSAAANATTNSSTTTSRTGIADNFDTFLTLLTTQLRNQNPLDPLDTNQFTQQLVQFAGVEQQLKQNDTLAAILSAQQTNQATTALGLVGKTVTAKGDTTMLDNGTANWKIKADANAAATIEIRNANGALVATKQVDLTAGDQNFTWDGKTSTGGTAPSGLYSIVVTAKDATGGLVSTSSEISGVIDGIDLSGGDAVLTIGALSIPLSSLKQIKATPSTGA